MANFKIELKSEIFDSTKAKPTITYGVLEVVTREGGCEENELEVTFDTPLAAAVECAKMRLKCDADGWGNSSFFAIVKTDRETELEAERLAREEIQNELALS